jgi:hypothetical protein
VISSIQKHKGLPTDLRPLLETGASAATCIQSVAELRTTIKSITSGSLAKPPPLITPLSWFANAATIYSKVEDLLVARDSGEQIGRAMQLTSTCIGLIAMSAATGGMAVVIPIFVWGLNLVGGKVYQDFSEAGKFIRACQFGDHVSFLDDSKIGSKLNGDRKALPTVATKYDRLWMEGWRVSDQLEALEEVMYDFQVTTDYRRNKDESITSRLVIDPRFPQCLASDWTWAVAVDPKYTHLFSKPFANVKPIRSSLAWNRATTGSDTPPLSREGSGKVFVDLFTCRKRTLSDGKDSDLKESFLLYEKAQHFGIQWIGTVTLIVRPSLTGKPLKVFVKEVSCMTTTLRQSLSDIAFGA